jgi:hypothetical protein
MRLLPIAIVASWLAQSVVAEVPNKYLSVGLLSVVCQNDAKKADEDFYVFSREGDSWTSIVGNVTSIHETAEGFTLKLSNSPHETSFLKRTNEGYNLVSFKKGETSKKLCTDLTLLSADIKRAMSDIAEAAFTRERQVALKKLEGLRADLRTLKSQNMHQKEDLAALTARGQQERSIASNTIESLQADLQTLQAQNADQKEDLAVLKAKGEEERTTASNTIKDHKAESEERGQALSKSMQAISVLENSLSNSQTALEKISDIQTQPSIDGVAELALNISLYSEALNHAVHNVSVLRDDFEKLEIVFGKEAKLRKLQSENASQQEDLVALAERYDRESLASAEEIARLRADLEVVQSKNAGQQAELSDLAERYEGLRGTSAATIEKMQANLKLMQASNAAQQERLVAVTTESLERRNALLKATQAIAELKSTSAATIEKMQTDQSMQIAQKIDKTLTAKLAEMIEELDGRVSLLNSELAMATTDNIDAALKDQAVLFRDLTIEFMAVIRSGINQGDPEADKKMQALMDTQSKLEARIGELNKRLLKASQRPKIVPQKPKRPAARAPSQDVIKFP